MASSTLLVDSKVFQDVKSEFLQYISSSEIGELLAELTEKCFENNVEKPKEFIAQYCGSSINESNRIKLKNKYKRAKNEAAALKNELAASKKELQELKLHLKPKLGVTKAKNVARRDQKVHVSSRDIGQILFHDD